MSAPERIWARIDAPQNDDGDTTFLGTCWSDSDECSVKFVRADLHDTLRAERDALAARVERLEDALTRCLAWHDKDKYSAGKMTVERSAAFGRARAAISTDAQGPQEG
jgi:hypothetical protein